MKANISRMLIGEAWEVKVARSISEWKEWTLIDDWPDGVFLRYCCGMNWRSAKGGILLRSKQLATVCCAGSAWLAAAEASRPLELINVLDNSWTSTVAIGVWYHLSFLLETAWVIFLQLFSESNFIIFYFIFRANSHHSSTLTWYLMKVLWILWRRVIVWVGKRNPRLIAA